MKFYFFLFLWKKILNARAILKCINSRRPYTSTRDVTSPIEGQMAINEFSSLKTCERLIILSCTHSLWSDPLARDYSHKEFFRKLVMRNEVTMIDRMFGKKYYTFDNFKIFSFTFFSLKKGLLASQYFSVRTV